MSEPLPIVRVACAAIERDGAYLVTQRRATAVFANLWEFPGGRVEPEESDEAALVRVLHHRLGVQGAVGAVISVTHQTYRSYVLHLALYPCSLGAQTPTARRVQALAWVHPSAFGRYAFAPADEHAIDAMLEERGDF